MILDYVFQNNWYYCIKNYIKTIYLIVSMIHSTVIKKEIKKNPI